MITNNIILVFLLSSIYKLIQTHSNPANPNLTMTFQYSPSHLLHPISIHPQATNPYRLNENRGLQKFNQLLSELFSSINNLMKSGREVASGLCARFLSCLPSIIPHLLLITKPVELWLVQFWFVVVVWFFRCTWPA